MTRQLTDMTCLITGASSGIGKALAIELAAQGVRLAVVARREDRLRELVAQLPGSHLVIVADIADEAACQSAIQQAYDHFGRIDTVVCNAGYGLFRSLTATSRADWDAIMATNVHGTLSCIRTAVPLMQAQELRDGWRGQIMIVSSILGRRSAPICGAYSATKAAQLSIAEALRLEQKDQRIAVTSVHPVGTRTDFFTSAADVQGQQPLHRTSSFDQTAEHVARRMRKAIARPCPEVWPSRPSRWFASWCTFAPRWADRLVGKLAPPDPDAQHP